VNSIFGKPESQLLSARPRGGPRFPFPNGSFCRHMRYQTALKNINNALYLKKSEKAVQVEEPKSNSGE